jgi:hypothetical protein
MCTNILVNQIENGDPKCPFLPSAWLNCQQMQEQLRQQVRVIRVSIANAATLAVKHSFCAKKQLHFTKLCYLNTGYVTQRMKHLM